MSLNPLKMRMAFNSPIFSTMNSNSHRSQIVRTIGPREVKYGNQVLKPFERASISQRALVNQSAFVSENRLMSGSALVKENSSTAESALMNESELVNEDPLTEENEPLAFKTQLSRLRIELREDREVDDKNWVIRPRPGDVFS